jgi:hypothetical protein
MRFNPEVPVLPGAHKRPKASGTQTSDVVDLRLGSITQAGEGVQKEANTTNKYDQQFHTHQCPSSESSAGSNLQGYLAAEAGALDAGRHAQRTGLQGTHDTPQLTDRPTSAA